MRYLWSLLWLFSFTQLFAQAPIPIFEEGHDGIQLMMKYLLHASPREREAFGATLFPTKDDCAAIFDEQICEKVYRYQRYMRRQIGIVVQPLASYQTDFLIWQASTQELSDYRGEAQFFPGGYKELAPHLREGFIFYRIKFVQPGHKIGSAYDVLVFVNGKWRLFQRPWSVLF